MTDTTGGLPPAGWYPDPYGEPFERWWDGAGWTEHTNTPAPAAPAEPAEPEPVAAEPVAAEPYFAEPVAAEPIAEDSFFSEPKSAQPAAEDPFFSQPKAAQPVADDPFFAQPASAETVASEPVAYQPPPLEEPPAATADPFAGFVSPAEPAPYQAPEPVAYEPVAYEAPASAAPAYEAPYTEAPAFEPSAFQPPSLMPTPADEPAVAAEPAPYTPYTPPTQGYDPEPTSQVYGTDLFGQAEPVVPAQPTPAQTTSPGVNAASSFDFGFGDIIAGTTPSNESVPAPQAQSEHPGEDGLFGSWEPNEYSEPLRNSQANAGLTLGVLSFFLSALAGIPGLILSVLGIGRASRFDREGAGPVGRTKAFVGIALSVVGTAVSTALILYGLQLFAASQQPADDEAAGETPDQAQVGEFGLEVGEMGTITLPDSDAAAIQFTVTSITPNFTCTAPEAVSPENGQFIAVAVSFTLAPEYLTRMTDGTALRMNQSDWIGFLGDESATQVDSTDAGNSCISAEEQLPSEFPAGENISGIIVLDMAEGTASVSYAPSGVEGLDPGMTRWEWVVPA